ncbi:MAG: discoidin domain-containing protein [Ignavibacteria bacterium]|nr:discoidin domain-containing protein [Ignavibacteria bacterium]
MKFKLCLSFLFAFLVVPFAFSQQAFTIDDFADTKKWKVNASDLVEVSTSTVPGVSGDCLKLDFNFVGGSGYGGIQTQLPLSLPANYEFSFYLKANSPNNNLEFKLLDTEGTSVWWTIYRDYTFPKNWVKIKIKQRHISKAWGPTTEIKPTIIDKIEFMISSVNGGKGTLYFDDFTFTPLDSVQDYNYTPEVISPIGTTALSNSLFDKNLNTEYSLTSKNDASIIIDLHRTREFGGLKIDWSEEKFAKEFTVSLSEDNKSWKTAYTVKDANCVTSFIPLPEAEARYLKLDLKKSGYENGYSIKEIELLNLDFSSSPNNIYKTMAKEKPRGFFPKYLLDEASYFTVVGVNGDRKEALINEEGQIEVDKSSFSLEPFILNNGKFLTWNETKINQSLEEDYLPIPIVKRTSDNLQLTIKTFADREAGNSTLNISYRLKNTSGKRQSGKIYFAIRPFQVNPSYQFLNTQGGIAKVESITYANDKVVINNDKVIYYLNQPDNFGASDFDQGDIVEFIAQNNLPKERNVADEQGFASAAFEYQFTLAPGEEKIFHFVSPFHTSTLTMPTFVSDAERNKYFDVKLDGVKKFWKEKLNVLDIKLPPKYQKWINTLRTTLAYILINRDSVGIQPGSRSYERSWIRDGSLTSSALLKLGITKEVKEFIDWYASFQYANGKVPCVVDRRGADPVPENDSHGQLIYLINQYFLFTKDTTYLRLKFNNVVRAVDYIEYLMNQRRTENYKIVDSLKVFYGLLPESISHEGYSEKPMHSYWDDFFAIKGLKDAVEIAAALSEKEYLKKFVSLRDEFSKNLINSLSLAIKNRKIDYIPGCAELGDFDATSTAISLYPCNEKRNLPQPFLDNTFDRYFDFFTKRRDDPSYNWINYTPYEIRTVGAFIYLNQPERAHALLDFFFRDQRPQGWNHWAEVVWKDPKTARFIGDMPHTWVGSDYISSLRSFFVYEDELNNSLVLGAGLLPEWLDSKEGISFNNLLTYYGSISYSIKKEKEKTINISVSGKIEIPDGGIVLKKFPIKETVKEITINGKKLKRSINDDIVIRELPAAIKITY